MFRVLLTEWDAAKQDPRAQFAGKALPESLNTLDTMQSKRFLLQMRCRHLTCQL